MDYVDVRVRAGGEARACGVYVLVRAVSVLWCADGVVEAARYVPHSTERLMSRYMQTQHKNKVGQS